MASPSHRKNGRLPKTPPGSPQPNENRRRPTITLNYLVFSIALIALYLLIACTILITFDTDKGNAITMKEDTKILITEDVLNEHRFNNMIRRVDKASSSLSSTKQQIVGGIRNREEKANKQKAVDNFCGTCQWKDAGFTCNERVIFEVEKRKVSIQEAKMANLEFCTDLNNSKAITSSVGLLDTSAFCGSCMWKGSDFTCNERVEWEVMNKKVISVEEGKISNLAYCVEANGNAVGDGNSTKDDRVFDDKLEEDNSKTLSVKSDFCGIRKWKELRTRCTARVQYEIKTYGKSIEEAKLANLKDCFDLSGRYTDDRGDYILSPICGGCFRAKNGTIPGTGYNAKLGLAADVFGTECNSLQFKELQEIIEEENGMTILEKILESNKVVAQKYKDCEICDVDKCWKRFFDEDDSITKEGNKRFDTKYWRFDKVGPKISKSVTLALPSLPEELRIPSRRHDDIEVYLTEKYDASGEKDVYIPFLVEYNPSLVQIPPKMKPHLPPEAAYLTTLRVTPANNCFKEEVYSNLKSKRREIWDSMMWTSTNHLGIALLDENYQMIPGYDAVIDLAREMKLQREGKNSAVEPTFMDYRLSILNGDVYLNINSDTVIITKLMIRSKDFAKEDDQSFTTQGVFNVKPLYGGEKLDITILHQFNTIWSGGHRGKNFALFTIPNATHPYAPDSIYAEININPYHKVSQIYPDEIEMLKRKPLKTRPRRNHMMDGIMIRKVRDKNATISNKSPHASFSTVDEHWFPGDSAPFESFAPVGHGGACCIQLSKSEFLPAGNSMKTGNHAYLLVGIAHSPSLHRTWYSDQSVPESDKALIPFQHYVSFLYAFEPMVPFNLRAQSGYFCLGYADKNEGMVNPNSVLTKNRKLRQHNEAFECPQISFVSTLVEKVGDPSKVVIGYGLNDCTARLVDVSKQEIASLLFPDPLKMNLQERK